MSSTTLILRLGDGSTASQTATLPMRTRMMVSRLRLSVMLRRPFLTVLTGGAWPNNNDEHPIAQSLPIPIGLNNHRQTFGIPAYEPKTSLSDRPGMLVPALRGSSASSSLRRASYAERDRVRPVDPGALDFAVDDEYDDDVDSDPETGGKARQRALRILKARNEMPPAGELIPLLVFLSSVGSSQLTTSPHRHVEKSGLITTILAQRTPLTTTRHLS